MGCRIGMTTNEQERYQYWRGRHPRLYNWQVLARGLTYESAQQMENRIAAQTGCTAEPGGRKIAGAAYLVYRFDY